MGLERKQTKRIRTSSELRASTFKFAMRTFGSKAGNSSWQCIWCGCGHAWRRTRDEHDKHAVKMRKRRTFILIRHGDFMSLVLKRVIIVTGFGHAIETAGIPHRAAFFHFNTGITELKYFGTGWFLIMSQIASPHIQPKDYDEVILVSRQYNNLGARLNSFSSKGNEHFFRATTLSSILRKNRDFSTDKCHTEHLFRFCRSNAECCASLPEEFLAFFNLTLPYQFWSKQNGYSSQSFLQSVFLKPSVPGGNLNIFESLNHF